MKREACLLDSQSALAQAYALGQIRITKGTKGGYGRRMQRWIPVTEPLLVTLVAAAEAQAGWPNLIPPGLSLAQFMARVNHQWVSTRQAFGLKRLHDLRAAYACERYKEITGHPPPVFAGGKVLVSKSEDAKARIIISQELGHNRIDIIAAYIGGRKR